MEFTDAVEIEGGARITRDGYLVADALIARTGIQDYSGTEVGKPELARVRVYRPAEEVFHADALASVAHRPITIDHPAQNVTAENWRRLGVGDTGDEIVRDGERIRVPMKIMDAAAITAVRSTHRQFSAGYSCQLDWTPGEFNGETYDAVQREIRFNHVAAVRTARGGPELRIIDERTPPGDRTVQTKIITFDGVPVEVTDAAEAIINKLQTQATASAAALTAANTAVSTKDGEIAVLKQQVADAVITPAKLGELVAARTAVVSSAKAIAPAIVTDGKTDVEIKRAAVAAKLTDAVATAMDDAAIGGAFAALTVGTPKADLLRDAITDGVVNIGDAQTARDAALAARNARFNTAHTGAAAA